MDNNTIHRIIQKTGRSLTECSCLKCQSQCKTPCLGTPQDILKLINAGYINKLKVTFWAVGIIYGKLSVPIPMIQALQTETGCVFFKNGLCELHDPGLKPTEGKLSNHNIKPDNYIFELSLGWNVTREWINADNLDKIIKAFALMEIKSLASK